MRVRTCSECKRRRECVECRPERSVDARSGYAGSVAPDVRHGETLWLCAACAVEAGVLATPETIYGADLVATIEGGQLVRKAGR